ncbi:MAG: HVO_0758 family zinc finger protein [Halobacteriaceae archaeon]
MVWHVGLYMETVRKGLHEGELKHDQYKRLVCTDCGMDLERERDVEDVGEIRSCPECGQTWRQLD